MKNLKILILPFLFILLFMLSCSEDSTIEDQNDKTNQEEQTDEKDKDNMVGFYENGLQLNSNQLTVPEGLENTIVGSQIILFTTFIEANRANFIPAKNAQQIDLTNNISFPGDILIPKNTCFNGNESFTTRFTWNATNSFNYTMDVGQNEVAVFRNTTYLVKDASESSNFNISSIESKTGFEGCIFLKEENTNVGHFTWREDNEIKTIDYILYDGDETFKTSLQINKDNSGFITSDGEVINWNTKGEIINTKN